MDMEVSDDQKNEIELLTRTAQGDRKSFEQLYDRFSGIMFSTALRILNNHEEAQDVIQDVFVQIWDKAGMYEPSRGKPLSWIISLTRNKAIDRLRSAQRRYRLQDEAENEAMTQPRTSEADSSDAVYAMEKSRVVRSAVLQLSKEQRQAIELAYFAGLTQEQIAQELNEPLGTIKARIRRGMIKLKDIVAPRL